MAFVALMAVPVVAGPSGPETALGGEFVEDPLVGVVSAYEPGWLADVMRLLVAVVAAPVLFWAANSAMLGLSRHTYTLAVNRQIPSWLGKLGLGHQTPHVAILVAAAIAIGLVLPTDVELLAGIYAFGATLAITIAHFSIVRLRFTDPDRRRPFATPWSIPLGRARLPLPALAGGILTGLAFISVLLYHDEARWVGGGWMLFGLFGYVIYRRFVEETSLTERVTVTPQALTKRIKPVEYRHILVPIFGTDLDDDIVGTAGRLAAQSDEDGRRSKRPLVELVYVVQVPLTLPLDAALPGRRDGEGKYGRGAGGRRELGVPVGGCDVAGRAGADDRLGDRAGSAGGGGGGDRHRRRAPLEDPGRVGSGRRAGPADA